MRQYAGVARVGSVATHSWAGRSRRRPAWPAAAERRLLGIGALTALLCLAVLVLLLGIRPHAHGARLDLVVLACAPVAVFGRRWPLPVLGLAVAAAVAEVISGGTSLLASLMLGLARDAGAAGLPRWRWRRGDSGSRSRRRGCPTWRPRSRPRPS